MVLFQKVMQVKHLIHYLHFHQDVSAVCPLGVLSNCRSNSNSSISKNRICMKR